MKFPLPVFTYSFQNKTADGKSLDVYIDGAIVDAETEQFLKDFLGDETSISYKTFRNQIEEAKPSVLNLYLTGPGGDVGDGLAMFDYITDLQSKGTKVNVTNRGLVGSILTYFQLAVPIENRFVSENSYIVIHNVQGSVRGDLRSMQSYINNAAKLNSNLINMYVSNTKLTHQKITDMMDAETLITSSEMAQYGFVNPQNIVSATPLKNTVDISSFGFKNKAILNAYNAFTPQNEIMKIEQITAAIETGFTNLMTALGIKEKAGDEAVKNAFTEFSNSIINAIPKDVPTAESVQELVNTAVTNVIAKLGENETFKNAITEATKNNVTKDDIKDVVKETTLVEKLEANKTEIVNAVSDKMGNSNKAEKKEGEKKAFNPKNRFARDYTSAFE